jgi:hypothetical protein
MAPVMMILSDAEQLDMSLRETLQALSSELKFERVIFWGFRPEWKELRLRYQVRLDPANPLAKLPLAIQPGSFLSVLTEKAQSFLAPAGARAQLAQKYQDEFFQHGGNSDFAIMSVFAGHELAGVFYADNPASGRPIDPNTYAKFKALITHKAKNG